MRIHVVFRHTALEIFQFILHIQYILCAEIFLRTQQACIGKINLKIINVLVILKRFHDRFRPVYPGKQISRNKPFDCVFIFSCPGTGFDHFILKTRIFLGKLHRSRSVCQTCFFDFIAAFLVFTHIVQIIHLDCFQDMPCLCVIMRINKPCYSFRHSSDGQILPIKLQRGFMQCCRHRCIFLIAVSDPVDKILFSHCKQEFLQIHRVHRVSIHFSDRERIFLSVHRYTKEASGRNNMIFRSFFLEILQRGQRSFTKLNLIKNNERISPGNRLAADMGQDWNQISRTDAFCEGISQ